MHNPVLWTVDIALCHVQFYPYSNLTNIFVYFCKGKPNTGRNFCYICSVLTERGNLSECWQSWWQQEMIYLTKWIKEIRRQNGEQNSMRSKSSISGKTVDIERKKNVANFPGRKQPRYEMWTENCSVSLYKCVWVSGFPAMMQFSLLEWTYHVGNLKRLFLIFFQITKYFQFKSTLQIIFVFYNSAMLFFVQN